MNGLYAPRDGDAAGALDGLQVLDLTIARAGPTCVRQLADMGADVIQIARPGARDLSGSDAHNLHRNKRSIAIDLKHPDGHAVFRRLVARADVLVENFRADVKQRLGIDYETLSADHPALVYASISGFGQEGPYAQRAGVDQIAQGLSGLMSVTGPPGTGPWRTGIAVSDTAAGTFLTQGVLAALLVRERTGRGQWVHTSLLEALVNFMDFQAARWLIDGEVPGQAGNDHPTLFPMGAYETADGMVNLAAITSWKAFLSGLGDDAIARDARFASGAARRENREALDAALRARLRERTTDEWVARFAEAGVPCGPILDVAGTFDDPQVRHLELTRTVEHAAEGEQALLRLPLTFSETPASVRAAAPLPGADTDAILDELGYADRDIDAMVASGAVARESRSEGWS